MWGRSPEEEIHMPKPDNRFLFLILALGLMILTWGCSQTDDITASKSLTNVWLSAERLPSPPADMIYELWVAKNTVTGNNIPDNELVSLGRFSYVADDSLVAFLDETGAVRGDSNQFVLPDDIFEYSGLFVTVEQMIDAEPNRPGPIMLVEPITGRTDTIRMDFPLDVALGDAGVFYNMETPSDGSHNSNDGYGLWFTLYGSAQYTYVDTLEYSIALEEDTVDIIIDPATGDTLNLDSLYAPRPDSAWVVYDTVPLIFGSDTLTLGLDSTIMHVSATVNTRDVPDSTPPFTYMTVVEQSPLRIIVSIDTVWEFPMHIDTTWVVTENHFVDHTVDLDIFSQERFDFPVYADWGWNYQGWVTSLEIDPGILGEFTPPAYVYRVGSNNDIPGDLGGLMTTGTFQYIDSVDDGDPFTLKVIDRIEVDTLGVLDTIYRKPVYPGEDFLDGAALSAATGGLVTAPYNLLPAPFGSQYGTVFISIEPVNRVTDTTNFPLIAFLSTLPNAWDGNDVEMTNRTRGIQSSGGFPRVRAIFQRL